MTHDHTAERERRTIHRRFSDRRVALMLAVHEILFEEPPGERRERRLIEAIRDDYQTDRAALVARNGAGSGLEVVRASGQWDPKPEGRLLDGNGIEALLDVHQLATGAVTLTYVRRPSQFEREAWEQLWSEGLGSPTAALLSVELTPARAPGGFLWLAEATSSREWSSGDRELIEEIGALLARAADKEA